MENLNKETEKKRYVKVSLTIRNIEPTHVIASSYTGSDYLMGIGGTTSTGWD